MPDEEFTDKMSVSDEKLADELDPGLYKFVSPEECRAILVGTGGDTLKPSLPEVILRLQTDFHEPWSFLFANNCPPDALASICPLAASFIAEHLMAALQAMETRGNHMHRLYHTGQGAPLQVDPTADREALIIISGFRDERSLTSYLSNIGFEPPQTSSRRKRFFTCDVFIPHSDSPGDPTASGLCHLIVRRTHTAIELLEDFMSGKSVLPHRSIPQDQGW